MSFRRTPLVAVAFAAIAAAAAFAPASAAAQATPAAADSMAFPRQIVSWINATQADSLFAHSSDSMKTRMQSPANITAMLGRVAAQLGTFKSSEGEYQFEKEGKRVYIAVLRHETAPDLVAHVIRYVPGSGVADRINTMPLTRAKELFPEVKLP